MAASLCRILVLSAALVLEPHGSEVIPAGFEQQLRCPFAAVWLQHGAERAAEILGVAPHLPSDAKRRLGNSPWATQEAGAEARCQIAPGPIGAAHQLAQSQGYDVDCQGTPAERSPYMWPLKWTANVEQQSVALGSDEVQYESRGRVWYMLDRNWKRSDTWFQKGTQRAVGQAPCETNRTGFSCERDSEQNRTVLHRNGKMVFIHWAEDGTIEDCSWLDLGVVGNLRPDWFMDGRGASTDVQYLGSSHVYHRGMPRLVMQWRKQDFAGQYFTMSMQANAGSDGVHWPLLLNVPGEGFGDDFLQHWYGHRELTEAEASDFLLDEAHVAAGGQCPQRERGAGGPPTGESERVRSNLEVDAAAWRSIVYTASPIWQPPAPADNGPRSGAVEVAQGVYVESCFDATAASLRVSVRFELATTAWAAVGFRTSAECLMTPRDGSDGEVVFAQPGSSGEYQVTSGALPSSVKHFSQESVGSFTRDLVPLGGASATYSNEQLVLAFGRASTREPLYLSFAYGSSEKVGYHSSRGCFTIEDPPVCAAICRSNDRDDGGSLPGFAVDSSVRPVAAASAMALLLVVHLVRP